MEGREREDVLLKHGIVRRGKREERGTEEREKKGRANNKNSSRAPVQ